ncbi:MAG: PAS domain-containing protein [Bacteroidales bacterium]|nr:PAS domain-containing protein [Bacteroidales bacterium]MBN2763034.1 PAS domain-containing protein [Bacteroidales bacterium]
MSPIFFQKINAFLIIFDVQKESMIWANDYFFQTTGNRRNDNIKLPLDSFLLNIHPNDRSSFLNIIENSKNNESNGNSLICRIKSKANGWIWVFSHFSIYESPKKGIVYFVNYATEIDCSGLRKQLLVLFEDNNDCFRNDVMKILTRREKEIFQLIVNGNTNKEISEMLNISIHTTKTHRKRIIHKMGIKNSTVLIRTAVEHGIC